MTAMTAQTPTMTTETMSSAPRSNQQKDFNLALIITAGGSSSRMGGVKKEFLALGSGTVLSSGAKAFLRALPFSVVAVTYPLKPSQEETEESIENTRKALYSDEEFVRLAKSAQIIFAPGGSTRQKSVFNALKDISRHIEKSGSNLNDTIVFIHDGARPFVTEEIILSAYEAAVEYGAAVPGIAPVDTQVEEDDRGFISRHLVRSALASVQTPQVFFLSRILSAHALAEKNGFQATDDTSVYAAFESGARIKVVAGDTSNKKITYKEDLEQGVSMATRQENTIRVGFGYDKHALVSGRPLMIGGIEIESDLGEEAHSDGDVLLHAVTDALLGASGLGDIGSFFPPDDDKWKGADSKMLLKAAWEKITGKGWKLLNLDCVLAIEKPKILPHRQRIISTIAKVLCVDEDQVFIKAKTGEKLGDVGQRRAVEAWATCLLEK